jgi:tRNA(adenine34) deaminase
VSDLPFLRRALELARAAGEAGEVPIGAVVVREGAVVGEGRNRMEELRDATAHAEMFALREASKALGDWRLDGCTLYASLEPCPMCAGAALHARIGRVVYSARDVRLGACRTHWGVLERNPIGRVVEVEEGQLESESAELLRSFFRGRRQERGETPPLADRGAGA